MNQGPKGTLPLNEVAARQFSGTDFSRVLGVIEIFAERDRKLEEARARRQAAPAVAYVAACVRVNYNKSDLGRG
jgi:hypothetical protein